MKKLLDINYPLLAKFRDLAPGSFKHCQNVAILCEGLANELELDPVFLKVCAQYHDIGKMLNPSYFTENQNGDPNPHDNLDPRTSYLIITKHVADSVAILLDDPNIPREVIEVVLKHHGNTVLVPFYKKSGTSLDEAYRYKYSKSNSSPAAAVLMIVDSVEAAARSFFNSGKLENSNDSKKIVTTIIDNLRNDEQLDNMTVGMLRTVQNFLIKELDSIYHKRVSYEDEEKISIETKESK